MNDAEVVKCDGTSDGWQVERFDSDGGVEITAFYGNNSRDRAVAYAKLLNF